MSIILSISTPLLHPLPLSLFSIVSRCLSLPRNPVRATERDRILLDTNIRTHVANCHLILGVVLDKRRLCPSSGLDRVTYRAGHDDTKYRR